MAEIDSQVGADGGASTFFCGALGERRPTLIRPLTGQIKVIKQGEK